MSDKQEKRKIWVKSQDNAIHCVYECEKKEKEIIVEDWVFGMPFHYTVKNENIIGEKAPDERIKELEAENASLRARLEKAVELPRIEQSPYNGMFNGQTINDDTLLYYIEDGHIKQECFNNKFPEQLKKRLAELNGCKQ